EGTLEDLKEHIKLSSYKNVPYGIAIGFSYNPVDVLVGDKSSLRIKIEVYTKSDIENMEVKK
ncbi:MAG: hypothetical protein FGF48_06960, partial [Candidatus Brockarchaeota archaeon]|nr:hypothetical protein [Candidatus Brockarchaeota archaeon]